MINFLFVLIVSYGLCFGFQNKFPFGLIYGKVAFLDKLLACTYCTGFHTGWMAYLAWQYTQGLEFTGPVAVTTVMFAFASAGFCYAADAMVAYLEAYAAMVKSQ